MFILTQLSPILSLIHEKYQIQTKAIYIYSWRDRGSLLLMAESNQIVIGIWGISCSFHSLVASLVTLLVIGAICLTGDHNRWRLEQELDDHMKTSSTIMMSSNKSLERCDLFSGKWVFDNKSYPLYKEKECSFMLDDYACEKFGRKDLRYQNWRWQPHQCDLPRSLSLSLLV